jgi:hypothetical protein
MISLQKLRANRENARRSTGPKSALGKARSSRNAHRHGLAVRAWSDHNHAAKAEALAREIAGAGASAQILTLARHIVEAQIELFRVQHVRHDLLTRALSSAALSGSAEPTTPIRSDLLSKMAAIDRYERRAMSHRKTAIRAFDAARARQVLGMPANSARA